MLISLIAFFFAILIFRKDYATAIGKNVWYNLCAPGRTRREAEGSRGLEGEAGHRSAIRAVKGRGGAPERERREERCVLRVRSTR